MYKYFPFAEIVSAIASILAVGLWFFHEGEVETWPDPSTHAGKSDLQAIFMGDKGCPNPYVQDRPWAHLCQSLRPGAEVPESVHAALVQAANQWVRWRFRVPNDTQLHELPWIENPHREDVYLPVVVRASQRKDLDSYRYRLEQHGFGPPQVFTEIAFRTTAIEPDGRVLVLMRVPQWNIPIVRRDPFAADSI